MNEDFVSFELAVKLKEKGFDEPCNAVYNPTTYELQVTITTWRNSKDALITSPTISQVLKWLLEEKKIYIEIGLCHDGYFAQVNTNVYWGKDFADEEELFYTSHPRQRIYGNITPEQAALAGIEYVLDNLI